MPDDRLIVALDVPSALEALEITEKLGDTVSYYKIGLGMLTGGGLACAMELKEKGKKIFLDMKLFDISNTSVDRPWRPSCGPRRHPRPGRQQNQNYGCDHPDLLGPRRSG